MRKHLAADQERMRLRLSKPATSRPASTEAAEYMPAVNPVDYSKPVEYAGRVTALHHTPCVGGVYMLAEHGEYYIGQTVDVYARFASHRLKPINSKMIDPRGYVLAEMPSSRTDDYGPGSHMRLRAEARFIAAALSLNLRLTNTISPFKRGKLSGMFADLAEERERIRAALRFCANLC